MTTGTAYHGNMGVGYAIPQASCSCCPPYNQYFGQYPIQSVRSDPIENALGTEHFNAIVDSKKQEWGLSAYDPQKTYREWDKYRQKESGVDVKKSARTLPDGRKGNLKYPVKTDDRGQAVPVLPKHLLRNGCEECGEDGPNAGICEYHVDKDSRLSPRQAALLKVIMALSREGVSFDDAVDTMSDAVQAFYAESKKRGFTRVMEKIKNATLKRVRD